MCRLQSLVLPGFDLHQPPLNHCAAMHAPLHATTTPTCHCRRVRAAYKAVPHSGQALLQELPQCGMGALLLQWVRQVKRLEVAAARAQETAAAAKDANTAMTECETVLAAARQAQVRATGGVLVAGHRYTPDAQYSIRVHT